MVKKIEEGERKITEKAKMAESLRAKVMSCDNPWQVLLALRCFLRPVTRDRRPRPSTPRPSPPFLC